MPRDPADDPTRLLAEMRARVEGAAAQVAELTAELEARDGVVDELESALDALLGWVDLPIVTIDADRRIRALSRGAVRRFEGESVVGKPLSSVVPDDVFTLIESRLSAQLGGDRAAGGGGPSPPGAGRTANDSPVVEALPGGGAVVVLGDPR